MTPGFGPAPVWIGVAVRLADGSLQTFELTDSLSFTAERTLAYPPSTAFGDSRRFLSGLADRLTIEVSGRGGTWSRFDPATAGQPPARSQPPILPALRAIEPGPGT